MEHSPLNDVLILLGCSVLAVIIFRRIHLPPILGYLTVGILAGSHALGWVPEGEAIHLLAEIGVVFLLFMIGLEISIPHLIAMKGAVIGLGGAQVAITTFLTGGIALASGVDWKGALIIGGVIALSSTAIAAKQMVEQLEIQSRHGRTALAILLFQDLAVVPFLVIIPILAGPQGESMLAPLAWAMLKGTVAFLLMIAIGHWLLRPFFHAVAGAKSIELFTLTILFVALAAATLTYQLGLSLALGAFLAGMMLGETEYRHQIESEVRPFRDVLMGLFFISVGAQLNLSLLPDIWHWVLLITLGIIIGKAVIIMAIVRFSDQERGVAIRTGLILAQGGEFGFALITLSLSNNLLSDEVTQPVLTAIIISMILAPLMIRYNGSFAKKICADYFNRRMEEKKKLTESTGQLQDHVIICGFGRIGQNLAGFLREEGFEYIALDIDPVLIREAREAGEQIYYGDSRKTDILEAAGIQKAQAVISTYHDYHLTEQVVCAARNISSDIMIVARTHDDHHLEKLEAAGANDVVPEALEASMMLASHALRHLGVDRDEIRRLVDKSREDHYQRLRSYFHGEGIDELVDEDDDYGLRSVVLSEEHLAVGKRIGEIRFDENNIKIIALRRQGIHGENPSVDIILQAEDTLVIQGLQQDLEYAEELLFRGW